MKKSILLITLLMCALFSLNAQAPVLHVYVTNTDGEPLEGIAITAISGCESGVQLDSLITNDHGLAEMALAICSAGNVSVTTFCGNIVITDAIDWTPNDTLVELFLVCGEEPNPLDSCDVEILPLESFSGGSQGLYAEAYGAAPFTFNWSNGATTQEITNLAAGEYCVTVTTALGCQVVTCETIKENTDSTDSCYAEIIQLGISPALPFTLQVATYGDAPFIYNWSTGETTPEIVVEEEGQYCVTVTTATGCQTYVCQTIEDYTIDSTGCTHVGRVVDLSGLDGCGLIVETEDGQRFEPVNYPEILEEGQTIAFGYIASDMASTCMVGPIIEFTCLEVIYVDSLCIDPANIHPDTPCYEIYAPVCGCNGITYENDCVAEKSGVISWTQGACANQGCKVDISYHQDFEDSIPSHNLFYFTAYDWHNESAEYSWDFGDGGTATGAELSYQFLEDGVFTVCVTAVDSTGFPCIACTDVYVGDPNEGYPCEIQIVAYPDSSITNDSLQLGMNFDIITTASQNQALKYFWDFGDGTQSDEASPYHEYLEPGAYFVCVEIAGEDGDICGWCDLFFVGEEDHFEDDCFNFDAINLEEACPELDEPVCGCDGVTYQNACIAETCFGLKSWTTGPCPNDPTNPIDSIAECDIAFEYTITSNDSTGYDVQFVSNGDEHVIYLWDFGDGVVSEEQNPTHNYEYLDDGNFAFTVCLFTIGGFQDSVIVDSSLCFGNYCETLVIDQDPDGLVDGTIYADSDGIRNGAVTRSNEGGEPLAEVSVMLLNAKGEAIAQSITDDKGQYSFANLLFGNYQIKVDIEGIEHEPFPVKLDPVTQAREGIDFNVSGDAVTTSTSNITFAQNINVYPNPVTTKLQIDLVLPAGKELTVKVSNLFGQIIAQEIKDYSKGNQKLNIDMTNFASGIYMISISSDQEVYTQKVIKQ